jgi:hypothetical protein
MIVGGDAGHLDKYIATYKDARRKWGDRVLINTDHSDLFEIWLEFSTEEEAALFKLTEL